MIAHIEKRGSVDVLVYEDGGCHPASIAEIAFWEELEHINDENERLLEAVENLEMWFARDGESANDCYERVASLFQRETGHLRPGKSYPISSPAPEDRQEVWDNWAQSKINSARSLLAELKGE